MRYLLILLSFIFSQDTEELDLDAMWENTVWIICIRITKGFG